MDAGAIVRSLYDALGRGDIAALHAALAKDVSIFVSGDTTISGDHSGAGVDVLLRRLEARRDAVRRELLDVVASGPVVDVTLHEYVTGDGSDLGYHSIHQWVLDDAGSVRYWWYLHEYDQFEAAWR